jgi:hypothetical protein
VGAVVWQLKLRKKWSLKNKIITQKPRKQLIDLLKLDEKIQSIPWIERPIGALEGVGSP